MSSKFEKSDTESEEDFEPQVITLSSDEEYPVYTISSDSEPDHDVSDSLSDTETPVRKKLKVDMCELPKFDYCDFDASKSVYETLNSIVQVVESANTHGHHSLPDEETEKIEENTVESENTKLNEISNVAEKKPVKVEDINTDDNKTTSAIAETELDNETKPDDKTEAPPISHNSDKILKEKNKFVSIELSNIDDNPCENKSDDKKEFVKELINQGEKQVHGLSSVLGVITGKGKKMSENEKSQQDWMQFKQSENLAEELETYNKEKQRFLEK